MAMKNECFSFENLNVWKESRKFVLSTYRLLDQFPPYEKYALCDQLRRAVISVPSNIAEGSGRLSLKEKIRFIEIAYASLMEVYCQLLLALDLGYISSNDMITVKRDVHLIAKMLNGLKFSFSKQGME